ncbi:MAG: leucine-rich repeat domain-containing protein [Oscillibacter sp.]|nr:leucine-rich repeat domain-containing protein [Oscillibacter sp.]
MDIRSALEKMLREFGAEIFRNPKRMVSILRDIAPGLEAESNTLRQLAERGLFAELEQAAQEDDARRGRVVMKLRTYLTDYLQLSEELAERYVALLLDLYGLPRSLAACRTLTGREGNLTWELEENGLLTVSGVGAMQNYVFASDAVNTPWWERRMEIAAVRVGEGVTAVGDSAFYGCGELKTVTLPESVVRIGEWAFADCARLDGVKLPQSLRRIERGAFSDCKALSGISVPDGVSVIESWTFCNCPRLRRVEIPDTVSNIGQRAFQGCALLSHVQIPAVAQVEDTAFDRAVILTRRVPRGLSVSGDAPSQSHKPGRGLIELFDWLNAAYQKFLLLLFALVVLLRHGSWTLLLLLAPVGLLLLCREW